MIKKEYGTHPEHDLSDPKVIESVKKSRNNLWSISFLYESEDKWAMIDLDCGNPLINNEEIYEGVEKGKGRFSRLHEIWKTLNSPEYRLEVE